MNRHPFTNKYAIDTQTGCWNWIACLSPQGYGHVQHGGRVTSAHRASFELHKGPIPDGFVVDHLCRNKRCVNPEHLDAITRGENARRGSHCKLTAIDVKTIKELYAVGDTSYRKIARRFGISNMHVSNIINELKNRDVV